MEKWRRADIFLENCDKMVKSDQNCGKYTHLGKEMLSKGLRFW